MSVSTFLLLLGFKKMFLTRLEDQKWGLSSEKFSTLGTMHHASDFKSRVCMWLKYIIAPIWLDITKKEWKNFRESCFLKEISTRKGWL